MVKLTHPDTATGSRIPPACLRLNRTQTGISNLRMIDGPRGVFDPEPEQTVAMSYLVVRKNYLELYGTDIQHLCLLQCVAKCAEEGSGFELLSLSL